jgi:DNA-binding NarL/FixJ family response regulator
MEPRVWVVAGFLLRRKMESGEPATARLIVADDHPLFRWAMCTLLESHSDSLEVVAEATDGQQALELCRRLRPDLVLMDVIMPRMDGLEATRAIKGELPRTIVLMMSASEEPTHMTEAIKAGATGYVLKSASPQQITDAIRRALDGEFPFDQEVAVRLLLDLMDQERKEEQRPSSDLVTPGSPPLSGKRPQEEALPPSLTGREVEVLGLMVRGHTNQEIAQKLFVSVSTVKKHVHHIIEKLAVSDRTQAIVRAIEEGLLSEPQS